MADRAALGGKLNRIPLLLEEPVLCLCREMPFAAVARLVGVSWHRVAAVAERYEIMNRAYEGHERRQLGLDLGMRPVAPPKARRLSP